MVHIKGFGLHSADHLHQADGDLPTKPPKRHLSVPGGSLGAWTLTPLSFRQTSNAEDGVRDINQPSSSFRLQLGEGLQGNGGRGGGPVSVALIDDDVLEVGQQGAKLLVQGQDALVQHVGVGHQHLGHAPDLPPITLQHPDP